MRRSAAALATIVTLGAWLAWALAPAESAPAAGASPSSRPTTTAASAPASPPAGAGSVSGKVVDAGGRPVGGADVSVFVIAAGGRLRTLAATKSAKDGSFKIAPVPAGQSLRVWAVFQVPNGPALMGELRDLKVEAGKDTDVGAVKIQPATM